MKLRVKEILKEKGLTVQTLAERMGINRVGLSNHINGNPSVAVLDKIATALNVPIQDLFEREDSRTIKGYIEVENEIFRINSYEDLENILHRFKK